MTVSSSSETPDQIRANFAAEAPGEKAPLGSLLPAQEAAPKEASPEAEPESEKAPSDRLRDEKGRFLKADGTPEDEPEAEEEPEPEKEAEKGDDKDKLGKPRHDPRARMLQATQQAAAAKRERDEARAEAARLRAELEASRAPAPATKPAVAATEGDPEPKEDQFQDYRDYVKAQARWEARQEYTAQERQRQIHEHAKRFATERQTRLSAFANQIQDRLKSDPDFMDRLSPEVKELRPASVLGPNERPGPLNAIAEEIVLSEKPLSLLQHFSENPAELQRIATLSPRELIRAMATLEARLAAVTAGAAPRAEISQAKPPVRPVTGSPHAADPLEVTDDMSVEEWFKRMNAKERRARQ